MTQDKTMLYLNNAQQVYNTQLGSNNPPRPRIQHWAFQLWRKREKTLSIILGYRQSIIVKGKKTPWNTLVEILHLRRSNHSKYPTSTFYYKPRGAMVKIIQNKKPTSQYLLDMKTDQLIHWNQILNMSVNRRLLR